MTAALRRPRITIRIRLTVLFALLFAVLAAVLVGTSYAFVASATTPEAQAQERAQALQEAFADQGIDVEIQQQPPHGRPNQPQGPVQQALRDIDEQARQNVLHELLVRSLLAFAIGAVVAVGLAYWLAGRVLRPVDRIARAAGDLSESTLDRRLEHRGPDDEFGRLTTSFNGMLARLEGAFQARQRFASDASHELRTPLAVLQASADNVLASPRPTKQAAELAEQVRAQVARSDSLIASLLTLSRADDVIHTREPLDLADLVARVATEIEPRATERGIELDLDVADAPVRGDAVLLERMVLNLLDNAIRYNVPDGGRVACRVLAQQGWSQVSVENTGPVVAQEDVPALFERFRRGAQRTEVAGHGLGLPIVSRVADVHAGQVHTVARPSGGLQVVVSLPSAPA